jgi:MFS transporter, putative metabolite:H+ symporter
MEGILSFSVLVAALGYFVDIYDLLLFGIVRVPSLKSLGVAGPDLLQQGVFLLNMQMTGLLIGGVLWGILGDKRGRIQVLFGSILLYSIANLCNAGVTTVMQYGILRFIAGIGLAGELGAAITLVTEKMHQTKRGYGTAVVAGVGLTGAVAAGTVAQILDWRTCYVIGGLMGLMLLILRIKMAESGIFLAVQKDAKNFKDANGNPIRRGDLKLLFSSRARVVRFARCILIAVPIWYVIGILITFAPEFGRELGITEPIIAAKSIGYTYAGVCVGDLTTGALSQYIQSRKKIIIASLIANVILIPVFLMAKGVTASTLYAICVCLGLAGGYWAVFMTTTAEQFGTNLRATVTTAVPNLVRGAVVPLTLSFNALRMHYSLRESAAWVGVVTFSIAFVAAFGLKESYQTDLDYLEV